jgi:hypothetical protein
MKLPAQLGVVTSKSTLGAKQRLFSFLVSQLIEEFYRLGYAVTFGDAWDADGDGGHMKNSVHHIRLAVDVNLFKGATWLDKTEDHQYFGQFWKALHPLCRWGGDFSIKDGNHYSVTHSGKA